MPTITVPGYRTNTGNPADWWVDTGIDVNKGDQVTIFCDASNPDNWCRPWPWSDPYGPNGKVDDSSWDLSLAYVTGEVRCDQFSLIARIGGNVFCVGESRTKTAENSGRLYLAFNDGANFEDNSGSWSVDVTVTAREDSLFTQLSITYTDVSPVVFSDMVPPSVPLGLASDVENAFQTLLDLASELNGSPTYAEVVALYVGEELLGIDESNYYINPIPECGDTDTLPCVGAVGETSSTRIWQLVTEVVQRQFWAKCSGSPSSPCSAIELAEFLSHNVNWNTNTAIDLIIAGLETRAPGRNQRLANLIDAVLGSVFDPNTGVGASTWGNYTEGKLIANLTNPAGYVGTASDQVLAINWINEAVVENPWVLLTAAQRVHLGLADG